MKKTLTACFVALGLYAQAQTEIVVPSTQNTLINKVAADWCPPCGSWGWDFFDGVLDENENAVAFVLHHSGGLQNAAAVELTTNFGANYQPKFFLDGIEQNVSSGSATNQLTAFHNYVQDASSQSASAQTGLNAYFNEENELTVATRTIFFEDIEGDFFLGSYIIEKSHIAYQASIGNEANHRNILRTHIGDEIYGIALASGSIAANTEFTHEFSADITDYDPANLEIVTILWKFENGKYEVVNTNKDITVEEEEEEIVNVNDIEELTNFTIAPTIVANYATIQLNAGQQTTVAITIVNTQGQVVQRIFEGKINAGKSNFEFNKANLANGQYFVQVKTNTATTSQPIIIQ